MSTEYCLRLGLSFANNTRSQPAHNKGIKRMPSSGIPLRTADDLTSLATTHHHTWMWHGNNNDIKHMTISHICIRWWTGFSNGQSISSTDDNPDSSVKQLCIISQLKWTIHAITLRTWMSYYSHNRRDGVSNHQPHDCLLNRLLGRRSKKTKVPRHWLVCGEFTGDQWIPRTHMASNAEKISIW